MATIKIFNNDENRMETYFRNENEAMPYINGTTLLVREFRGSSKSDLLWSTKRAMQSWNSFRFMYGRPIHVGYAFKRPYEGGHSKQSQHYAGVAFDVGQNTTSAERNAMRTLAYNSGLWSYVEPASLTPTWVHFDRRFGTSACGSGGYPIVRFGSISTYVLILQDALTRLGYTPGGIDGIFGNATLNAVTEFQKDSGLTADGIVGCFTWTYLMNKVVPSSAFFESVD